MHKKKVLKIVGSVVLFVAAALFILEGPFSERFMYGTADDLIEMFLLPIGMLGFVFLPLLLVLYFLSEPRFNSWLRLTKWYAPISIAIIAFFPGIDGSLTGFDREFMTWFSTGLYFLLSVIAIARRPKLA
jgi:hypothetical protein